ncbi:putative choline kinase 3 [Cucumispora dikerogammari]|nr:putative choline kinase 3 [Cucumispora dikerogammari]
MKSNEFFSYLFLNLEDKRSINFFRNFFSKTNSFCVSSLTGGYTNEVFKISLNRKLNEETETKHFIIKIFKNLDRSVDEKICKAMREPRIHFTNQRVRVEEYIESKPVILFDDRAAIIDVLKSFHTNQNVQELRYTTYIPTISDLQAVVINEIIQKYGTDHPIVSHLNQLHNRMPRCKDTYIIHNDLLSGNILKTKDGRIFLIDFEYACLGTAELELACLFEEMVTDYNSFNSSNEKLTKTPDENDINKMISRYFGITDSESILLKKAEIEKQRVNVLFFHLLWCFKNFSREKNVMNFFKYASYKLRRIFTNDSSVYKICLSIKAVLEEINNN